MSPDQLLDIGTAVIVGNRKGTIVKAEFVQAHPCGVVPLHTIKFTQKRKILTGNRTKWIDLDKVKIEPINYASINKAI